MFQALLTRFRALRQRRRAVREMDDELRFHVEMETQANLQRGMSPTEARRVALSEFGGVEATRDAIRDVRMFWLDSLWQDLRYALRAAFRQSGSTFTAATMLGLAVGLTTAMFTVADALILRPVPFEAADDLAMVYMGNERGGRGTVAPAVFEAWQESGAFAGVESAAADKVVVESGNTVAVRTIARVTPGLFDMLGGIRPIRGRLFDRDEGLPGADDRVLISADLWRSQFRADPTLIGRRILLNGESLIVVGVLPAEFRFPTWDTILWRPVSFDAPGTTEPARTYVRFSPALPPEDALRLARDVAHVADPSTRELWPRANPVAGMVLDPYYQRAVPLLAGGVVLVFVVLCANVCSLLLARLTARRREFGMRAALGASRPRLIRQALVESGVLGLLGVAIGVGVGWVLISFARAYLPEAFLLTTLNPLNLDLRALAVTSAAGMLATLVAGLLPAWIGTRVDLERSLRIADRSGTETRAARAATRALLMTELALACMLLVGATVLVRSFINLSRADRGIDVSDITVASISLPRTAFPTREARTVTAQLLEERVRQLPGIRDAAWSYGLPPEGGAISFGLWQSDIPGATPVDMVVDHYSVGPEFFRLYNIPVLRGRGLGPADPPGHVVIGERFARVLWPGRDPVDRRFSFNDRDFLVVGVAREIHHPSVDPAVDRPEFWEPFSGVGSYTMLSVRCAGACPDVARVHQALASAHPAVSVVDVRPLEREYIEQLARPRAAAALGFVFAGVAVLAAAGGLFSVLSYAVSRRRREFGIRTALGASPRQVRDLVLRDGLMVALIGIGIGAAAAWPLTRAVSSLQYGVTVGDPVSWLLVLGMLGATTIVAAWRPASEAMRVDPVLLLREE